MSDVYLTDALSVDPKPKRRYLVLAFLLSLISIGVGHLYVGQRRRAWAFFIAHGASIAAICILLQIRPQLFLFPGVLALIAIELGIWLYAAIDAALIARRRRTIDRQARTRWYGYALVVAANLALSTVTNTAAKHIAWRTLAIPSASMLPTLHVGDFFMVWRQYFVDHEPQRGDIAIITLPRTGNTISAKRIIGLPGDRVQMRANRLYLNDEPVSTEAEPGAGPTLDFGLVLMPFIETLPDGRRYEIGLLAQNTYNSDTPVFTVPADSYFVLGDNRNNSFDSRMPQIGFVARDQIHDKAIFIFWSHDWHRIGQILD